MRKGPGFVSSVVALILAFLAVAQAQNTITTLAGGGPNNLPVTSSSLGTPWGLVQDGNGNTYLSDNFSNRVFKVDSHGTLTVLAGNTVANYNGDNHLGTVASIDTPEGIALDSAGNVYFADTANNAIRVINTQSTAIPFYGGQLVVQPGNIQTLVGGTSGYSPQSVRAVDAPLNLPGGVWLDQAGNIYIADTNNSVIEAVNMQTTTQTIAGVSIQAGFLATIAGTNVSMYGGDGGPALAASLNRPAGIFLDASGNIYIADTVDSRIRVINTQGTPLSFYGGLVTIQPLDIDTVAGSTNSCALSTDPCGDGGTATNANLNGPSGVYMDGAQNIYIADTNDNKVRKVDSTGTISTIAGTGTQCFFNSVPCGDGGAAASATLWAPTSMMVDGQGRVLIADQNDDAIRAITGANINTIMGVLLDTAYSGDAKPPVTGTPTDAEMRRPAGVSTDANGNVFIADTYNSAVRAINTQSTPVNFYTGGPLIQPGSITTVAGNGLTCSAAPCGDGGPATAAQLSLATDVAVDGTGNLFLLDYLFQPPNTLAVVREVVKSTGIIQSVVGSITGGTGYSGDGGQAVSAQLDGPTALTLDAAGNIYIADTNNNAIRVVNTQAAAIKVANITIQPGTIATVVGDGTGTACGNPIAPACGDGGPATSAQLNAPGGVAVDAAGNLYVSDSNDLRVRIVDSTGTINPFAGTGAECQNACGDGGDASSALLDVPQHLFIDHAGNVFIADSQDFSIREVTTDGKINTVAGNTSRGFSGDGGPATLAQLAIPFGVTGDPFGNLLISDFQEWRVRMVTGLVVTAPRADFSPTGVTFPAQAIGTKSASAPVTLSNTGNGTNLTIAGISFSGANAADFSQTNNCTSVPGPGSCTINVSVTPTSAGARNAVLMVTDNAAGSPQSINLAAMGQDFALPTTGTLSTPTISAGSTSTATITITPGAGLATAVDLTCAVTPATAVPPTCALNPTSLPAGTTTSTLTVSTVAATSGAMHAPGFVHRSAPMYAIWLLLPGMLLSTAGMGASRRRKLLSYFLIFCAVAGCLFLVACGGGSSGNGGGGGGGGGGGTPGTTAGAYTVTVTAKTGSTTASQTFPLTVQ